MREISLETERRTQLIDITDHVREALDGTNGATAALVYVPHTTAGVAINEQIDPELVTDLENAFQRVVGDDWEWRHDDEDGPNAPSHARASLASSPQVLIPLATGARPRHVPGRLLLRVRRAARAQDLRHDAELAMAAPVAKGDELELDVDSLAYGGNGVARLDGFVVFVRRGLPGDLVRARVTKVKRSHAEALAIEVLEPGAGARRGAVRALPRLRRLPLPGSRLRGAARGEGAQVRDALAADRRASPTRRSSRSSRPSRRSSTTATSSSTRSRRRPTGPALGFHRAGRWDEVLEIERCWLTTDLGNAIRDAVREWAREERLEAYDQADASGYLRHLVVREGRNTGQALVQLVTAPGERFETGYFVDVLRRFPEVRSIHWAVNDRPAEVTNLPTGCSGARRRSRRSCSGCASACGRTRSCRRTRRMAERLYELALEYAGLTGDETVYDLYCGIGTIGLSLAARRADGVGDRGLGGVGRLRARERRPERDHERGVLRRRRRRRRSRSCASARARRTSSSSTRRAPGSPGRRCGGSARSARRGSSTSRATRRRSPAT